MEKMGLFEKERRSYQMEYLSRVSLVECPVLAHTSGGKCGVLLSSVKLPYRRYPSHVYLFALLLTFIGLSMRTAAKRIRTLFEISKFSHSTISRDTDRLYIEITRLSQWQPKDAEMGYEAHIELPHPRPNALKQALNGTTAVGPCHGLRVTCSPPKHWRKARPGLCECLFHLFNPMLQTPEYGNRILFAFSERFECLLL